MAGDTTNSESSVSRREVIWLSGSVVMGVGLAGCSGDGSGGPADTSDPADGGDGGDGGDETGTAAGGDGKSGGTLNIAQVGTPVHFDPIRQADGASAVTHNRVYSELYTWNEGAQMVPNVASKMPEQSREGTRWVIELVDNAEWHNGDPLTAEDVEYSLTQPVTEQREQAADYEVISNTEIIDDYTLQVDLESYDSRFRYNLTKTLAPKSVREEAKTEQGWNDNFVGSGSFEFVEWNEGESVRLRAVDDHWNKTPHVDEVEIQQIAESTTRATSLRSGDIDIMLAVPPQLWNSVESANDSYVTSRPGLNYNYIAFNINEGQTTKYKVREGITQAFSMDDAVDNYIAPGGQRTYASLPIAVLEAWDLPVDEYQSYSTGKDIDRAKQLFDEADVPSDWSPTFIVTEDQRDADIATSVVNGIREAGYDGQVRRLDIGTFLERYHTGNKEDYEMYMISWSGTPAPLDYLYNLFHRKQFGGYTGTFYENPEMMDWLDEARTTSDRERSRELIDNVLTTVLEDRVHIPAFSLAESAGAKQYVKDFQAHPAAYNNPRLVTSYSNVWLDQ